MTMRTSSGGQGGKCTRRHADRTKWVTTRVYCNAQHIYRLIPIEQNINALHSKHRGGGKLGTIIAS